MNCCQENIYFIYNNKKEIAITLYKAEKISLAKAAEIADVSFIQMKKILVEKGINPRLGAESAEKLKLDYLTKRSKA